MRVAISGSLPPCRSGAQSQRSLGVRKVVNGFSAFEGDVSGSTPSATRTWKLTRSQLAHEPSEFCPGFTPSSRVRSPLCGALFAGFLMPLLSPQPHPPPSPAASVGLHQHSGARCVRTEEPRVGFPFPPTRFGVLLATFILPSW